MMSIRSSLNFANWTSHQSSLNYGGVRNSNKQAASGPEQSTLDRPAQANAWRDGAWLATLDRLDGALRSYYGVHEYTDDPDCVFRIALDRADHSLRLTDGTCIDAGEMVGCLHFWNEHLPRFSPSGPDLGWAKAMQSKVRQSLQRLCLHMELDAAWLNVKAIRADAPLAFRPLARQQIQRLAQRHGFEAESAGDALRNRIRALGENMLLWGFVRAYNPAALTQRHLRQDRQLLWLSRRSLLATYGVACHTADNRG